MGTKEQILEGGRVKWKRFRGGLARFLMTEVTRCQTLDMKIASGSGHLVYCAIVKPNRSATLVLSTMSRRRLVASVVFFPI